MPVPEYPVHEFAWIFEACRVDEALHPGDSRLHDFTNLLGNSAVVELADVLQQRSRDDRFHHSVLVGHRGSGKSTQLLLLKEWADKAGFLTVWNEVDLLFGLVDLQFSDLFLLAAESVERTLRENGTPLPQDKLKSVVNWFSEVTQESDESSRSTLEVKSGAEASMGFWSLGKLFANFTAGVVAGSERHLKVRLKLRQAPNTLIDMTTELLESANKLLLESGRSRGLLILFDNLDRYPSETISNLLIRGDAIMRRLASHAIYTMPVDVRHSSVRPAQDSFDAITILSMIPLRKHSSLWNPKRPRLGFNKAAVAELRSALAKRLSIETLFEVPGDATRLVELSGGSLRDLLHLVNEARIKSCVSLESQPIQITHSGVIKGILSYRQLLTNGLTPADYTRLARIALRMPDACTLNNQMLDYLSRRRVLSYCNESGQWYDVHPLIIEDEEFLSAFETENPNQESKV